GRQIALPFTTLLVFATAKEPGKILSEALLRRVTCKLLVPDPTEEQYRELMRRACQSATIEMTTTGFDYVIDRCYIRGNRSARACHPAELVRLIGATARYFGAAPALTPQLIDMAAELYFV
ncbi:MAG: ATP-binding protein, partial [Ktedonobacterales bacterium]